jgi:hypothetical protein
MHETRRILVGLVLSGVVIGGLWLFYVGLPARHEDAPNVPLETHRASLAQASPKSLPPTGQARRAAARISAEETQPSDGSSWQDSLENVLASNELNEHKAQSLINLMRESPEPGQIEIVHHLVNLVDDNHYAMTGILLTNRQTSTNVLDVLTSDLLNRPNSVKLPAFVQILRIENHPKAGEARELLQHYVDNDFGADGNAWDQAVQAWLKDHEE